MRRTATASVLVLATVLALQAADAQEYFFRWRAEGVRSTSDPYARPVGGTETSSSSALALALNGTLPSSVTIGQTVSFDYDATGGAPPYAYALSGQPSGMAVDSNGTVVFTPEKVGSTGQVSITASDAAGASASDAFSFDVQGTQRHWVEVRVGGATEYLDQAVMSDGVRYAVGYAPHPASQQGVVTRFRADGTVAWSRQIGYAGTSGRFAAVSVDAAGNVVALGNAVVGGKNESVVVGLAPDGSLRWNVAIAHNVALLPRDVVVDPSTGESYVLLYAAGSTNAEKAAFLHKISAAGALMWTRNYYANEGRVEPESLVMVSGQIMAVGRAWQDSTSREHAFMVRVTAAGEHAFAANYTFATHSRFWDAEERNGVVWVAAQGHDGTDWDSYVAKLDSAGSVLANARIQAPGTDTAQRIAAAGDGGVLTGFERSGADPVIIHLAGNMAVRWTRTLAGTNPRSLAAPDGYFDIGGRVVGSTAGMIGRVAPDGSGTGVYGGVTYGAAADLPMLTGVNTGTPSGPGFYTGTPSLSVTKPALEVADKASDVSYYPVN